MRCRPDGLERAAGRRQRVRRRRAWLTALALVIVAGAAILALWPGSAPLRAPVAAAVAPPAPGDPFAYRPPGSHSSSARAIAGEDNVLFTAVPGGVLAAAARVSRLRGAIEAAVAGSGIDPDWLEGLVFVESGGRPEAIAGGSPANAAGLTQILPATATTLLGLHVDLAQSERLTQAIDAAQARGAPAAALRALQRRRATADQRFDPARALAGTVRYLKLAAGRFGRQDLAFVSYHMGMGNLGRVLDAYDGGGPVPYAQLFFDTAPDRHGAAYALLSGFSDQSWLYLWRVLGAAAVMHLYRTDRGALERVNALEGGEPSAAEVLHPPDRTATFADPAALAAGYADGALVALPANARALGLAYAGTIGAEARALNAPGRPLPGAAAGGSSASRRAGHAGPRTGPRRGPADRHERGHRPPLPGPPG